MFEGVEDIYEREGLKCNRCNEPTHHTKRMSVARAPPILVVHLKRFKIVNGNKKKID
jgi:ubiquitin C-terminal hydrolase